MRALGHSDARMLALHMVASAKAQEVPECPIDQSVETGTIGSRPPYQRYEWRGDRLTVAGHPFSVNELLDTIGRLVAMAKDATRQQDLFGAGA